jgi:hypothetical protein
MMVPSNLQDGFDVLRQAAKFAVANCPAEERLARLREVVLTEALEPYVKDGELREMLNMEVGRVPLAPPKRGGDRLDVQKRPWLWEGILKYGQSNLCVALPKVGKSAMLLAVAAAALRGETDCLGLPLHEKIPHLLIAGPDQDETDWNHILHREGLATETINAEGESEYHLVDNVSLWSKGSGIQLDSRGIAAIKAECLRIPGTLLIVDSLFACCTTMGIEEASPQLANPVDALTTALVGTGTTLVVIHHSNKGVMGGSWVTALRGSTSLAGAVSNGFLMTWLQKVEEGQIPTDRRIAVSASGRGKGGSLICELVDHPDGTTSWVSHGKGDDVIRQEAREQKIDSLGPDTAKVFAYIEERSEAGAPVSQKEVADELFKGRQYAYKASRALKELARGGLIMQHGQTIPGLTGGRPSPLWFIAGSEQEGGTPENTQTTQTTQTTCGENPLTYEKRGFLHSLRSLQDSGAAPFVEVVCKEPLTPFNHPVEVQLVKGGEWANGHITCGPAPGNQLFVRLDGGDPDIRKPLPLDRIRSCASPFSLAEPQVDW